MEAHFLNNLYEYHYVLGKARVASAYSKDLSINKIESRFKKSMGKTYVAFGCKSG